VPDKYKHPAYGKKVKFKSTSNAAASKKSDVIWVVTITLLSFFISAVFTVASSNVLKEAGIITALVVIFIIVLINIVFDIIGTAVTAAEENADKVSNVCNDVIGDICGIISGAAGAYIIFRIIGQSDKISIAELVMTGMITALTVGGKALGKTIALHNSNYIIYKVSVIISLITEKRQFLKVRRKPGK